MKTLMHIAEIPESGVYVILEGHLVRLFFDFTDPVVPEGEESYPEDLKACESIDVEGNAYGEIVSAIVNDHYSPDAYQAILANYELAKEKNSGITPEKKAEYLAEYAAFQDWRSHAKEVAHIVGAFIEG
jgi:hypothetical protein